MKIVVTEMPEGLCPFLKDRCILTHKPCDYDLKHDRCSQLIPLKDLQAISRERDTTKYNTMDIKEKKNDEQTRCSDTDL